jgi:alanine-glyoxylate transaminase/serine-glyoxylate transaminase/serine-pyruvate transaminase
MKLCAKEKRWRSDTVSAVLIADGFDSNNLVRHAYRRYGLSLGLGLAKLNGKVFRIGHLGDLNELMVLSALGGVELALRDSGVPIKAGSGVGAAVDYFHQQGVAFSAAAAE